MKVFQRFAYAVSAASVSGRPISAEDSLLLIASACVEQKYGTLYTVQSSDTHLLPGVIRSNTYRPKTYENGRKLTTINNVYFFVEPFLSVRKLLPRHACDRRETRDYYGPRYRAFRGFTDGEYEVPDNCDAPGKDAIALSGQQHSNCSCQYTCWQRGSEAESSA